MSLVQTLGSLVLQTWIDETGQVAKPLRAQSRRLTATIHQSWLVLEIVLTGEPFWDRLLAVISQPEEQEQTRQAKAVLDRMAVAYLPPMREEFRRRCLTELQTLLASGQPWQGDVSLDGLAVETEQRALTVLAGELVHSGGANLVEILTPDAKMPLLVEAARQFLIRAIDLPSSEQRDLEWDAIDLFWNRAGDLVEPVLTRLRAAPNPTAVRTLDLFEEWLSQGPEIRPVYRELWDLLHQKPVAAAPVVPEVIDRCRTLLSEKSVPRPALLNAVARLERATGDLEAAENDFLAVAGLVEDADIQSEAFWNAFQTALQRQALEAALGYLQQVGPRYVLVPAESVTLEKIVAADERGVLFLGRRRSTDGPVLIHALQADVLDRNIEDVWADLRTLPHTDPARILPVIECGYVDPATRSRPYLVLEMSEGAPLDAHVQQHGPLVLEELLGIAIPLAETLAAAHGRKIFHRGLKPSSVHVRRQARGRGQQPFWDVKLTDFGLSVRPDALADRAYAAPEQVERSSATSIGVATDIFLFARTCCFALFRTPSPTLNQWSSIPRPLSELLRRCLAERPEARPLDFEAILRGLQRLAPAELAQPARPASNPLSPDTGGPPHSKPPRKNPSRNRRPEPPYPQRPFWDQPGNGWSRFAGVVVGVIIFAIVGGIIRGLSHPKTSGSGYHYPSPSYTYPPLSPYNGPPPVMPPMPQYPATAPNWPGYPTSQPKVPNWPDFPNGQPKIPGYDPQIPGNRDPYAPIRPGYPSGMPGGPGYNDPRFPNGTRPPNPGGTPGPIR